MADAGYDPHEALSLWSKMANDPQTAGGGLQFLSSHPASADRLEALEALLPEALARYRRALAPSSKRPSAISKKSPARPREPYRHQEPSSPPSPALQQPADEDSFAVH
jgi:hypothetical protein